MIDHDNLEAFADPVDYDRQDSSDTGVAFYASLARETGGPVLEIACGTGRVAIPIARQGFAVTGLDVVPVMLELAALPHYNGFTVVRRYGDWDGEPLTAASPSIIVVCRKRT